MSLNQTSLPPLWNFFLYYITLHYFGCCICSLVCMHIFSFVRVHDTWTYSIFWKHVTLKLEFLTMFIYFFLSTDQENNFCCHCWQDDEITPLQHYWRSQVFVPDEQILALNYIWSPESQLWLKSTERFEIRHFESGNCPSTRRKALTGLWFAKTCRAYRYSGTNPSAKKTKIKQD